MPDSTIVVTHHRTTWAGTDTALADYSTHVSYVMFTTDIFGQSGGGEIPQVLQVQRDSNGNIVIRHANIRYPFVVPGDDWDRMTPDERAGMFKTLAEFKDSPLLRDAIRHMEAEGISQITIRWDDRVWGADGIAVRPFGPDETGYISYYSPRGPDGNLVDSSGRNMSAGRNVTITINSEQVHGAEETSKVLAHEMRHPIVPGLYPNDEW